MENEVKKLLKTKIVGKNIIFFDEIDSTQIQAKNLAEKNIENGTMVLTNNQLNGLGTHGRKWYSEKSNNISFTLVLYPKCSIQKLNHLTKDIAKYVVEAIDKISKIKTDIKEPNDIMLNGKKMGGILTQIITKGENIRYLLIGIGINVNSKSFPLDLEKIATSLKQQTKKEFCKEKIIAEFCNIFEEYCIRENII